MLKLMKYELRKTWFLKAILLAVTAVAEIAYLIGLYARQEDTMGVAIFILVMLAFGGILMIGLESVMTLHRDMNTKQSYMLFMTPNSCYAILGAKMLEFSISVLAGGAFFFALGTLDITLLFSREGKLSQLWKMIQETISRFSVSGRPLMINMETMSAMAFLLVSDWIFTIATAYLAVVISSALLNGKKYNLVISFLIFLVLSWGVNRLTGLITASIQNTATLMAVSGGISLAFAALMYWVTAVIMDRYLSV